MMIATHRLLLPSCVTVLSLLLTNSAVQSAAADDSRPLAHMVFFTVADAPDDAAEQLVKACKKYLSAHEGTVHFSAGTRAKELDRDVNDHDFDVALHLVFDSKKAHDRYQTNPMHLEFIAKNQHLWTNVRVFDSYVDASKAKHKKEKADDEEEKVKLEQFPKAVQATIKREAQGGKIVELEKETEGGQVVYEAEVIIDDIEYELEVREDGTLLSKVLEGQDDE